MSLERRIGVLGAEAMEQISERYGEGTDLRTAALVLEVDLGDATEIVVLSTDDRPWVQVAFLDKASETLGRRADELREEED